MDECVKGVIDRVLIDDPLEYCLVHSAFRKAKLSSSEVEFSEFDVEDEQIECTLALDSSPSVSDPKENFEVTRPVCEVEKGVEETVMEKKEGLVLKQLPNHSRYAFLGGQSKFPMIVSSALKKKKIS